MLGSEENFPRGGITFTIEKKYPGASENVFSFPRNISKQKEAKPKKRKRSVSPLHVNERANKLLSTSADILTYQALQEDMLVLGCVRIITPFTLELELPGKLNGRVKITSISNHYTRLLQEEVDNDDVSESKDVLRLKTMFTEGQIIPTKVISKIQTPKGTKVELSINPENINNDLNHGIFKQGLIVWAAVLCQLDHGYQLDAGVLNSRIFLPSENIEEGTTLVVGQPLWCVIKKSNVTSTTATLTVSILQEHLSTATQNKILNLHHLIPGMQFNFTVAKVVKNGLQGEFMNESLGYVNDNYLAKPLDKVSKYRKGETFKAWLLYLQPTTKLPYFTLRDVHSISAQEFNIGDKLQSQIVSKTIGGLTLKLPDRKKGFVSFNRIIRNLSRKRNINDAVANKFPRGSSHQCRILDYIRLEQLYICTFEEKVLKEKIFTINDVKLGELVTVKIKSITKEGLVVRLGNIDGFIHNIHLSNAAYSENIKKKFSVGQTLKARVWNIDERGVHLTHKQELINSDLCLCAYADAVVNQQYPGVVVNISKGGVLVVYFGGVRGILSKKYLKEKFQDYSSDIFYEGQVIKTTIKKVKDNCLYVSLNIPRTPKHLQIQVGEYVDAVVVRKGEKGLTVEAGPDKVNAFVPTAHLSSSINLVSSLLDTYKPGDTLQDLLCISNNSTPILSKREGTAYRKQKMNISEYTDLEAGTIIRCSYESTAEDGIYVSAPFKANSRRLKILTNELLDVTADRGSLYFEPQQAVVAKVTELNEKNKISKITAKMSQVFNYNYEYSLDLLDQTLQDITHIRQHLLKQGSVLAQIQLGQRLQGIVSKINDKGCLVCFDNDIKGVVSRKQCLEHIKVGQKVTGVVLWINYKEQYVELSLRKDVIKKVNEVQDGSIKKSCGSTVYADLLIVFSEYVVAVLRNQEANRQLIFLPTIFHENSFTNMINYDEELKKIKVVICRKVGDMLIGIDKQFIHLLEKSKRFSSRKRKQSNSSHISNKKARVTKHCIEHVRQNSTDEDLVSITDNEGNSNIKEESEEDESEMQNSFEGIPKNETNDEAINMMESFEETLKQFPPSAFDNDEIESEDESDDAVYENDSGNETNDLAIEDSSKSLDEDSIKIETDQSSDEDESTNNVDQKSSETDDDQIEEGTPGKTNGIASTQNRNKTKRTDKSTSLLPGVLNFFNCDEPNKAHVSDDSSDDEVVDEMQTKEKKKKKLTPAERKELERLKEAELHRIEIENADSTAEPQTVEQFQKLVKGKPNCSKSWTKYIAHLVSNGEFEKAKDIASEALKTIDIKLTQERYNIWLVRLNLEDSYGDKSTFNEIFEEAVRCNDDLCVYLDVIGILAKSQKFIEMEEKIKKAKSKFKQEPKMWTEIGRVYYENKQYKEARNLKDAALRTVKAKNQHVDLVVQFALLEFQFGEKHHGEALFETILQYNPKRVDVWCSYIDQVIKKGDIDIARGILERAVTQSIPAKKLKTLFQKFKDFEIKHGNKENVQRVIDLARKYAGLS